MPKKGTAKNMEIRAAARTCFLRAAARTCLLRAAARTCLKDLFAEKVLKNLQKTLDLSRSFVFGTEKETGKQYFPDAQPVTAGKSPDPPPDLASDR